LWQSTVLLLAGIAVLLATGTFLLEGADVQLWSHNQSGQALGGRGVVSVLSKRLPFEYSAVAFPGKVTAELAIGGVRRQVVLPPGTFRSDTGTFVTDSLVKSWDATIRPAAYATPVLGVLLLFLGTLQLRGILAARHRQLGDRTRH
jgi:hypothetical protein